MEPQQIARLEQMAAEHQRLLEQLASPEIASDYEQYAKIAKEAGKFEDAANAWRDYSAAVAEKSEAEELLGETEAADDREFLKETIADAEAKAAGLEARLREILTPRDPRDERGIIVEIRAGAGGDEAALFAGELMRMYQRFAERR